MASRHFISFGGRRSRVTVGEGGDRSNPFPLDLRNGSISLGGVSIPSWANLTENRRRASCSAWVVALLTGMLANLPGAESPLLSPLNFRRLTAQDGLPGAQVLCIHQDRRGFMWFGTADGLAQYDGRKYRIFRHAREDPDSIADNVVWDIAEDGTNNLWLATDGGLDRWDRQTERFSHRRSRPGVADSLSNDYVRKLARDPDGTLWLATLGGGLNHYDPRTGVVEVFLHQTAGTTEPTGTWIRCLHRDQQGKIWIGTEANGLDQFDPVTRDFRRYVHDPKNPASLSNDHITGMDEDREGGLWVSTEWGLSRLNPGRTGFERLLFEQTGPDIIMPPRVETVKVDARGLVWAGTINGGLLRYDPATRELRYYRHATYDVFSPVSDHVSALCEDRGGSLWVGHYPSGVSYADHGQPFRVIRSIPGDPATLSDHTVMSFLEGPGDELWVGTDGGGLNRLDRRTGRGTVFRHEPENPSTLGANEVLALFRDSQERFWVGTWNGGLDLFNPVSGVARHYRHDPKDAKSLSNLHVWRIVEDQRHQLWIATIGGGINRYVPAEDGFAHYRHDPGNPRSLNHDNVWSLLVSRNGGLWAGTRGGLARWEPATETWRRFVNHPDQPDSLSHNFVVDLLEDRTGAIWVATYGGGLNRLDPATGKFECLQAKDGLPSDLVSGMIEDDDGGLWVATNNGLARFDPRPRRFQTYDESNGLQGRHFSRNARLRLRTGELVFGGAQGMSIFNPRAVEPNTNRPPVVLTEFAVFNEPMRPGAAHSPLRQSITETRVLEIPASYQVISFEFAALDYRSPEKNQYAYRLHGFDTDWRKAGPERRATYTNLDPGRYRLQVKASNDEGLWNEAGTSLELIVVPPWWRTWTFRIGAFLGFVTALIATVWTVSHTRLKAQLREAEQQRLLAEERKRTQEERLELERKMREVQKLESLGVLAGGVAHDFNNLLTAILGNTSLALDELPAGHPIRAWLEEIQKSSHRAADLCRQMLAYAGRGRFTLETIQLNMLVEEMANLVKTSISKQAILQLRLAKDLPALRGDAGQIRQVLTNLIINAAESLGAGEGLVTVATGAARCSPEALRQSCLEYECAEGCYVWLEVADNGSGMDEETRRRMFEPFFTTKFMGRGLGLSAVLGIVRGHRGSITVRSAPGQGSTFRVYFPAAEPGGGAA